MTTETKLVFPFNEICPLCGEPFVHLVWRMLRDKLVFPA